MKKYISMLALALMLSWAMRAQERLVLENVVYADRGDEYSLERCRLDIWADASWAEAGCSVVGSSVEASHPAVGSSDEAGRSVVGSSTDASRSAVGTEACHPVIVWFHGGGLVGGNRFVPEQLKNCGFVIVAVNYRFMTNVDIRDCIDDAAAAVAWTFKHASEFGGDPSRIYVAGHSAGGYLTSMVGLDKSYLAKYGVDADSIRALFPFSGQAVTHFEYRKRTGGSVLAPTIDDTAPISHMRKDCPPYIIISGDRELELLGRYEENAYMWRMMNIIGHPKCLLYELDGFSHGSMAEPAFYILRDYVRADR